MGGVKGTKYPLKTRNHAPRTTRHAPRPTENQKQCPSTFLRKGGGQKIDFQDSGHLEFPIGMILAISDLQITRMLPTKFKSIGLSVQTGNIDFQDGGHLGLSTGTILAIFDLQVTLRLPTKFQLKWPFSSGEEKIDFQEAAILAFPSERF